MFLLIRDHSYSIVFINLNNKQRLWCNLHSCLSLPLLYLLKMFIIRSLQCCKLVLVKYFSGFPKNKIFCRYSIDYPPALFVTLRVHHTCVGGAAQLACWIYISHPRFVCRLVVAKNLFYNLGFFRNTALYTTRNILL